MRDLYADELRQRYGDRWTQIDWDASGNALSEMLTEQMGTRCRVRFEVAHQSAGVIFTRIDTKEFGADPASPKVEAVFESFDWVRFESTTSSSR